VAHRGAVARGVPNLVTSSTSPIGSENPRLIAGFHHLGYMFLLSDSISHSANPLVQWLFLYAIEMKGFTVPFLALFSNQISLRNCRSAVCVILRDKLVLWRPSQKKMVLWRCSHTDKKS
jgi:hypothetical protein